MPKTHGLTEPQLTALRLMEAHRRGGLPVVEYISTRGKVSIRCGIEKISRQTLAVLKERGLVKEGEVARYSDGTPSFTTWTLNQNGVDLLRSIHKPEEINS